MKRLGCSLTFPKTMIGRERFSKMFLRNSIGQSHRSANQDKLPHVGKMIAKLNRTV